MSVDPRFLAPLLQALRSSDVAVVVIVDRAGGLERPYFNAAAASLLGYTTEEFAALPVFTPVEPVHEEVLGELRSRIHRSGDTSLLFETSLGHRDGHRVPVEVVSHPIELEGSIAHVIVFRSLAPQQKTQLSLLEADRIALIGALAAGVAHEIKNPLTGMLLALRMLRNTLTNELRELPEPARTAALRALDDSLSGGERIASNVQALLSLAAAGQARAVDLGAATSGALRLVSPILEDRARVIREIHPVPSLHGDEARLGQAILSMLLFSGSGFRGDDPRDNRIVVRVIHVEQSEPVVRVEVSDNGSPISAKDMARAFDPFFVSRSRGAGLGVGLGVARSIAAAHGGTIEMIAEGAALTTRMTLPLRPRAQAGADASEAPGPPSGGLASGR
jgi:two-component system, NtrC family, sensor kinase